MAVKIIQNCIIHTRIFVNSTCISSEKYSMKLPDKILKI